MGWLFIDTHANGTFRVAWLEAGALKERVGEGRTNGLLPLIEVMVKEAGVPNGIAVVKGPGTFSSIRIGVLVANLLARLWNVSLVPLTVEEGMDLSVLTKRLAEGGDEGVPYIAPEYDAEPNITLPKT